MSLVRVLLSSVSFAMEAVKVSISDCRDSEASVFSSRVALFVASSVTHQVFFVASDFACSFSFETSCSIIFFTLPRGSAPTRTAKAESMRLFRLFASCCKNRATSALPPRGLLDFRNARALELWRRPGRCFSAFPATEPLEMISCALLTASISSERVFWRVWKAELFLAQVAFKSAEYFSSASLSALVSSKSPSAEAFFCNFLALNWAFAAFSFFDWATSAVNRWARSSNAWRFACSSFSSVLRSSTNLSSKVSSIVMAAPDWNSYVFGSGFSA
mmetsp:Transcript_17808/g.33458  ORF Transcript_17808/g.33458 Transcript_17808/m.33458 type:complete len:274 (-) Transcript_17808:621-1442(-)